MRACLAFIIPLFLLQGCQTSRAVSFQYHDATYGGETYKLSDKTSVLFLVDGLSSEILKTSLRNENAPAIADAFSLTKSARFSYGRAAFPSLTFPNITSILTGQSIDQHPVLGNRILIDDKIVNFENVTNWQTLARLLQRKTMFYKLAQDSQSSVSYSYAFTGGATAFQWTSPESAISYLEDDYASIDAQTLSSLQNLLTETAPSRWPRFIFVHLIGVDATAHAYGPKDERVQTYLHALDQRLRPIFQILNYPGGAQTVSNRQVNYALTADHGFRSTHAHAPLSEIVARMNRKIRVIEDNRVAPVYIDKPISDQERIDLAHALLDVPHVQWAALKRENGIDLLRKNGDHARITFAQTAPACQPGERAARFEWLERKGEASWPALKQQDRNVAAVEFTCLSDFDLATSSDDDSYIVPALADYFAHPRAPDLIFIPEDGADFAEGYAGNHGGLTREEMLVPVLTKDVDIIRGVHPTSDLLRTMGVDGL